MEEATESHCDSLPAEQQAPPSTTHSPGYGCIWVPSSEAVRANKGPLCPQEESRLVEETASRTASPSHVQEHHVWIQEEAQV